MTRTSAIAAITALLCFGILSADAEQSGTQDQREACTPDVYKLCNAEIPDEDRIVACLKKNKSKLSPACYKVFFGGK